MSLASRLRRSSLDEAFGAGRHGEMERGGGNPGMDEQAGGGNAEQFWPDERTAGPRASDGPSPQELAARRAAELSVPGHVDEVVRAADDKELHRLFPALANDELARLPILEAGTALEQGSTYLDLNDLA